MTEEALSLSYVLGVDVGTTRTAAAICRIARVGRPEVEVVPLGGPGGGVLTSLQLTSDGAFVVGELGDPLSTATGFAKRIGDDVPLAVGGQWCTAEELTALLIMWVVGQVAEREGPATHVVVTHPAGWGPYRAGLLHQALLQVGVDRVSLVSQSLAAVEGHSGPGDAVAVLDIGSHGVTCSAVRRTANRSFEVLAATEGVDHLAGADFDDLVLGHVRAELGREVDSLPDHLLARLRYDCEAAKRMLSVAPEAVIPVHLPAERTEVRLTRPRFEDLVRPALEHAVDTMRRTAGGHAPDVVRLVGGSSRIPLVAELVATAFRGRIAVEAAPETTVVKGAALVARRVVEGPDAEPEPLETSVLTRFDDPSLRFPVGQLDYADVEFTAPPPRPPVDISPLDLPERRSVKRVVRAVAGRGKRTENDDYEDGR